MKILLIDNYDSFTYNLYQQIAQVSGVLPRVFHNDQLSLKELLAYGPDCVVISPGPGRPDRPEDFGICGPVLQQLDLPILGVCLGLQGIAHFAGAGIDLAPEAKHGRISQIHHNHSELFVHIPQDFSVTRYHSLQVLQPLPTCLEATAFAEDGVLMALRHRNRPQWGIQFHPESICTDYGHQIIANFLAAAKLRNPAVFSFNRNSPFERRQAPPVAKASKQLLPLRYQKAPRYQEPESIFSRLFQTRDQVFWLDSSLHDGGTARFSFMGCADGPRSKKITYNQRDQMLTLVDQQGTRQQRGCIFQYLKQELDQTGLEESDLALPFKGGYVGWLGYELRESCADHGRPSRHLARTADAAFLFVDRFLAWDHQDRVLYLVAIGPDSDHQLWFQNMLLDLGQIYPEPNQVEGQQFSEFQLARDRSEYLADIQECLEKIRWGETYEVCLTNRVNARMKLDPAVLYRRLRSLNPMPYAVFIKIGDTAVICSSPERFLKIDNAGKVSSKPIKGTTSRHKNPIEDLKAKEHLQASTKERAENLMIVDLVRNDLGRVCEVGSVVVPKLMEVESYATVHQLVSTIEGQLLPDKSVIDCIQAAFPGGSMTGAPKRRTMEIIDDLETSARGIYSGAIGYLSLDGALDLNIVIRTIVVFQDQVMIGAGGAIVSLSDPEEEYEEMLLKAKVLMDSLTLNQPSQPGQDQE